MSEQASPNRIPIRTIQAVLTFILPLLLFLVPTSETFTPQIRLFFVITLMGIIAWATDIVHQAIPAILLPIGYTLFGLAKPAVIYGVWSGSLPWMILGGLILAGVLQSTGLLERIAYACITLTGGTYMGLLIGLGFTGIIGNLLAPGKMAIPMAALTFGICLAMDLGKSKASAGIMLGGAVSALLPQQFIYNPTNLAMTVKIGEPVTGPMNVTWTSYFFYNIPAVFYVFAVLVVIALMCRPKDMVIDKAHFREKQKAMGSMSTAEQKALVICVAMFALLIYGSFKGWDIAWVFAIFPCLFFFPGINVGERSDLSRIDFSFVLFITACLGVGNTAGALGIGTLISNAAAPILADQSIFFTFAITWLIVFFANFFMTPLGILATISLPMAQISLDLGINPLSTYFLMMNAYDAVIFPYEYALYLVFFSFGLIKMGDFVKIMSVKAAMGFVFCLAIMIPYWMLVGLL